MQQRIFSSANNAPFVFTLTDGAKDYLLREGTDMKYGARHLKRAIDRSLVHPLSNLIATGQITAGDMVLVERDEAPRFERMNCDSAEVAGWPRRTGVNGGTQGGRKFTFPQPRALGF